MAALLTPDTFWLTLANLLLGFAILSCIAFLVFSVINNLRLRSKTKREDSGVPDDYLSGLKDLGITILDEGRKIDEMEHQV